MSYVIFETNLGWMGAVGSRMGLCRIILPQPTPDMVIDIIRARPEGASPNSSIFGDLPDRMRRYFEGEPVSFPDRLDTAQASPFRISAWQVVCSIPYGETRSYSWVAEQIGRPRATRAVGRALARNPLPIVVPCHRVVGKRGLGGFLGGLGLKRALLDIEAKK